MSAHPASGQALAERDRRHLIHPYLPSTTTERVVMVSGQGSRLTDADGKSYLDATGGLWLAQVGHGRRELAQAAAEQVQRLEYFTSFWEFTNNRAIELAERLVDLAPAPLDHVYFTSGGSEGNDAAIKMARYAHFRRGEPTRTWIIARRNGYHGIAYGGGSATGFEVFHDGFGPMLPHITHLTPPWPYRLELYGGADPTDFLVRELEDKIQELGPENVAAMIAEPIMGVGGMLVPPEDYWPRVEQVLRRYGIFLIFDEVVTAYGRVGYWFAAERYGVSPDIIVTAKGITSGYVPLGAVLVSSEIAEALGREHGFPNGYTYNGHPTACAVSLANLDLIEKEGLLDAAVETGTYLLDQLHTLEELPIVGEARGVGMMLALELVRDKGTREPLPDVAQLPDILRRDRGVIIRDCAHNLVLSPPLIMTRPECDEVVAALRDILERVDTDGVVHG